MKEESKRSSFPLSCLTPFHFHPGNECSIYQVCGRREKSQETWAQCKIKASGDAGKLQSQCERYKTETRPRDTAECRITSHQLKGLISPQRDRVLSCAKPLRDASEHLLHWITFCFLISPPFNPLSLIFYCSFLQPDTHYTSSTCFALLLPPLVASYLFAALSCRRRGSSAWDLCDTEPVIITGNGVILLTCANTKIYMKPWNVPAIYSFLPFFLPSFLS